MTHLNQTKEVAVAATHRTTVVEVELAPVTGRLAVDGSSSEMCSITMQLSSTEN